jgi:hypothetical protein
MGVTGARAGVCGKPWPWPWGIWLVAGWSIDGEHMRFPLTWRGASALNIAQIGTLLRFFRAGPPQSICGKHSVWSHNP